MVRKKTSERIKDNIKMTMEECTKFYKSDKGENKHSASLSWSRARLGEYDLYTYTLGGV